MVLLSIKVPNELGYDNYFTGDDAGPGSQLILRTTDTIHHVKDDFHPLPTNLSYMWMMGTLFNSLFGVQVDGNDEPVKTQHLSKNEDQNHSYEETWLLGCASNTGITNNTYGKSGSQPTESYSQPCTQVDKPPEKQA